MSKKKLNIDGITNELEGASLFFKPILTNPPPATNDLPDSVINTEPSSPSIKFPPISDATHSADMLASNTYNEQDGNSASKQASTRSDKAYDLIRTIRKTVRQVGKEVLFVRLSPDEKHTLGKIVFSFNEMYRGEGRKTSENEVGRIGLNILLEDYRENGINSILSQVLAALAA